MIDLDPNHLVLIVDDSPDTLGMLNEALYLEGMTTLVALGGKQAIKISQKMRPDIILLDAIMPIMDGFETCKLLKADPDLKSIPVIFMTGLSDTESVVKGFASGGVDYLTKPIAPKELIARIRVHLLNARTTMGVQAALDSAGQNLFSVDSNGVKLWSTPMVNVLLSEIESLNFSQEFEEALALWLEHRPREGDKFHFTADKKSYTAIFFGLSSQGERLIRLHDDAASNETKILKEHFSVTERESEVFLWIAKGKTNREIALILEMKPRTVNKHLELLFKKLDVDNRTSAAALAIQCLQKRIG